ncbi:MAG TPA: glycosyltransferase family 4 protein [Myxococcota bacterium]|jgi:glycosyltransferase involved in cell wall biosynthesis
MRVLMLGWELPPRFAGGVGVVAEAMLRALAQRGHELTYLMPLPLGAPAPRGVRLLDTASPRVGAEGIASRLVSYAGAAPPIRIPGEVTPPAGVPLYGHDLLAEVERFACEAVDRVAEANVPFDVIHAHDWTTFRAGLALRERTGKPLVAHVHITEFDKSGGHYADPAVFALEREGIAGADRVVAVSRRIANTCRDRYGADPARTRVVYNGVDPDTSAPAPPPLPRPLVLFLGRITLQKGPEYFLEAARRVLEVQPDAHFVMAGTGDMLPRMIERAAELGIAQRVSFPGFVDRERAAALYAAADVFVMPSVSEPFGIVPLEAMDRGVPVIVSRQSGVSELITNALKCDPWEVERMAELVAAALRYPVLARALSENGRAEVANFGWPSTVLRIEAIYRELGVP